MKPPVAVVDVDVGRQLEPIFLAQSGHPALMIVRWRGEVLGQLVVRGSKLVGPEAQLAAIESSLGASVKRRLIEGAVARSLRGGATAGPSPGSPTVSVVVDASGDIASLGACLQSLRELNTSPKQIVVSDAAARADVRALCVELGVTHRPPLELDPQRLPSSLGAELVALTDASCRVDPGWLDRLDEAFADPLVMAVGGHVLTMELETDAQLAFERARGLNRPAPRGVIDGASDSFDPGFVSPAAAAAGVGSGANLILRRAALEEYGLQIGARAGIPAPSLHELETFLGLLSVGYRIAIDPSRIARCTYPRSFRALSRAVRDASAQSATFAVSRAVGARRLDGFRAAAQVPFARRTPSARGEAVGRLKLDRAVGAAFGICRRRLAMSAPTIRMADRPVARVDRPSSEPEVDLTPEIAVCVPSFGRREKLLRLLDALDAQTYPAGRVEVVVVVDGSTDGSADAARAMNTPYALRVIEQPHLGVAAARNSCAENSQAPLLLYLDDDMVPEPDLIGEHVRAHADGEVQRVALGYCPASDEPSGLWARVSRGRWEDHFRRKAEADHQWSWIDFSVGNASIRKELLERLGGFDEDFARRNEDQDLGFRLAEEEASFAYLPAARAWHDFDARLDEGLAHTRRQAFYDAMLVAKHPQLIDRVNLRRWANHARLKPKARVVYRLAPCGSLALRLGVTVASGLERLDRRRSWWRLTRQLMVVAYVLGMRDALPTEPGLRRVLRGDGVERTPIVARVELGRPGHVTIPAAGSEVDIELTYGDRTLARLPAMRAGLEWSWPDLIERATGIVASPLSTLPLAEVRRLAGTPAQVTENAVEDG